MRGFVLSFTRDVLVQGGRSSEAVIARFIEVCSAVRFCERWSYRLW